jgi:DNA-binding transcriptional ArsR family regulator
MDEEINGVSTVFSALGSPVRLKTLLIISETKRPLHIKAVAKILKMNYAAVYRHVEVLKKTNLLQVFEVGRSRVLSPLHEDLVKQFIRLAKEVAR